MRISPATLIIAWLMLVLSSCSETYFPEPESEGGWRRNTDRKFLISHDLNPKGVSNFLAYNLELKGATSAIVIKDGWVVGEWYRKGYSKDDKLYVASIGKSIALACFGIAVKDGTEGKLPVEITRF